MLPTSRLSTSSTSRQSSCSLKTRNASSLVMGAVGSLDEDAVAAAAADADDEDEHEKEE